MAKEVMQRSAKATRQTGRKQRREKVVQVRMNDDELSKLDKMRGSVTRSDYLRRGVSSPVLYSEHKTVVDTPQIDRVLMELKRIGVNVNQMARASNAQAKSRGIDFAAIKLNAEKQQSLAELRKSVDKLFAEVSELRDDVVFLANYDDEYRAEFGGDA